jgi:DNA-binding NtrC family response regulator
MIAPEHLPLPIVREASHKYAVARSPAAAAPPVTPLDALMEQVERRLITQALRRARGVKAEAARLLDMPYNRLVRRVRDLKISAELADNGDGNETASDEASADRDL